ncbi:hypothetical protein HAX54_017176, partial [Datura stramonium]|nr:hypothetical protein [Datura stramonium]
MRGSSLTGSNAIDVNLVLHRRVTGVETGKHRRNIDRQIFMPRMTTHPRLVGLYR